MTETRDKIWLTLIVLGSAIGLYAGWKLFWFLTDDSLIAFRYCSNSLAGLGYVWNPPPFVPVEGYTSFLWVLLMDGLWRLTGLDPTATANTVSLIFSGLTLLLVGRVVWGMILPRPLTRYRLLLLFLVLLGCLSNRTYLAWTSSGLETAMFNFFVTAWIVAAFYYRPERAGRTFVMVTMAALTYLSRPDGMLILLITGGLLGLALIRPLVREKLGWRHHLVLLPLAIPLLHLAWRVNFYGEWLPNTYYAKHVSAWPESGLRYFGSFVLEYGLLAWLLILLIAGVMIIRRTLRENKGNEPVSQAAVDRGDSITTLAGRFAAVGFIAGHIGYYTLIIGGDHFEYRVFSYVIPFLFVSCLWLLTRISRDGIVVASLFGLFILCGWPLPWTHWALTHDLETRDDTHVMFVPVADRFPQPFRAYAQLFDDFQAWLIPHHVCMRHQEHKIFYKFIGGRYPERSYTLIPAAGEYPVVAKASVGMPGWVWPRAVVLDAAGLNDYVIARTPTAPEKFRRMAHDRSAPPLYLNSFSLNYGSIAKGISGYARRDYKLSGDEIAENETYWIDRVKRGIKRPFPYRLLCRVGESYNRQHKPDSAGIYLSQAVELNPNEARGLVGLAAAMLQSEDPDSTIALLKKASELEPNNPLIPSRIGAIYADLGYRSFGSDPEGANVDFGTADQYFRATLKIDSCWSEALVELCSLALFHGRTDSAIAMLPKIDSCPDASPQHLHLLGERFMRLELKEPAMYAYRMALRRGLNVVPAQLLLQKHPELRSAESE